MRRVVMESPYAGDIASNEAYARSCLQDCLHRGESPLASHLLYTQPGVLQEDVPAERALGIKAGHSWICAADALVVYVDRGISRGMKAGIDTARRAAVPVEYRLRAFPECTVSTDYIEMLLNADC